MNRLTKRYRDGSYGVDDKLPVGENSYAFKDLLISRLGEYEDLGYTAQQLKDFIKNNSTVAYGLKYNKGIPRIAVGDIVPLNCISHGRLELKPLAFVFYLDCNLSINYEFEFVDSEKGTQQMVRITDILFS